MNTPNPPQFAHGSWTVPHQGRAPSVPLPHPIDRIPDNEPLVLRPHAGRFVAVFGSLYVGFPVALIVGLFTLVIVATDMGVPDIGWLGMLPFLIIILGGLVQLAIVLGFGLSGGPMLAANTEGVWIRARKWPAKSIFLPWPAVARVYPRRWLWDRPICVLAHDTRAGTNAGAWAGIDMGVQNALFGSRLTASTFYCGRRADDVLRELHHLSGGRVPIG